jgi:hypothetical protein
MHIPCVQPACDPLQVELPATTSSVHTGASENRASGSSLRHLLLLTPGSRSLPMVLIAPKHWSSCNEPPSSCSHHLPAHLRSARIVRCGENVKVSGGDKEGSSSQGCLSEVIPRCVAAGRRSLPDIHSVAPERSPGTIAAGRSSEFPLCAACESRHGLVTGCLVTATPCDCSCALGGIVHHGSGASLRGRRHDISRARAATTSLEHRAQHGRVRWCCSDWAAFFARNHCQ